MSEFVLYAYPADAPRAAHVRVFVNQQEAFVYCTAAAAFVCFSCAGAVELRAEFTRPVAGVRVRPYSRGLTAVADGQTVSLSLPHPALFCIETHGDVPLYIFANPPEDDVPAPDDPGVRWFAGGRNYDIGELRLHDNETLYLAGGAVLRGCVRALHARNIRVRGHGILDGSLMHGPGRRRRLMLFDHCRHVSVDGIVMIEPPSWMLVLGACQDVSVRNVKQLGAVVTSDGVDIVGSSRVEIDGCLIANNDDCIAIKSVTYKDRPHDPHEDLSGNVAAVRVRGCAFFNGPAGNAMEIGYELQADLIEDVVFSDCDVVHVHGFGAAISTHNSDRALVRAIRYENIRVEHCYDKLVELRVISSRYGRDPERGRIQDVTLKDIQITYDRANPGHTVSLIGGFDADHLVEDVTFDNVCINGQLVTCADQLDLYVKYARGIVFTGSGIDLQLKAAK